MVVIPIEFYRQDTWCQWRRVGDLFFGNCKYAWLKHRVGEFSPQDVIYARVSFSREYDDRISLKREGDVTIWRDCYGSVILNSCYAMIKDVVWIVTGKQKLSRI